MALLKITENWNCRDRAQAGAGLIEYCLLVALVCTLGMASLEQFGVLVDDKFRNEAKKVCEAGLAESAIQVECDER